MYNYYHFTIQYETSHVKGIAFKYEYIIQSYIYSSLTLKIIYIYNIYIYCLATKFI